MAEVEEEVELDAETRRYVLDVHGNLERISHYELLSVPRDADKKTIKRAYFRLAATLHPDRYFGKKLGSFKPKMELLFRKISEAHDLLLSAEKRAQYDATLGAPVTVAEPAEDPRAAAQRRAEEETRAKQLEEARARAKPHLEAAQRARSAGDLAAALGAYRVARTLLPDDKDLEQAQNEVQRAFAERASESFMRQALLEEKHGHWKQAAMSWTRVAAARPNDENVRARLANALAKARSLSG